MNTAVIISTYNSPSALEKVLWGYAAQTSHEFELIVADDGSGAETKRVIEQFAAKAMPVNHVWHPDRGFRKCTILNLAIAATDAEYLIITDGDCIPRNDFVSTHLALREPGRFLSGGAVRLSQQVSERIEIDDIVAGRATDFRWLRDNGINQRLKVRIRMGMQLHMQRIWDRLTPTAPTLNGNNTSAWRRDIVAANGFDERMVYGGEDRELGERLENAGVFGKQVRHRAVCVHLHHERGYVTERGWQRNNAIRCETRQLRLTTTPHGISQFREIIPFRVPSAVVSKYDVLRTMRKAG